jgi:hypothetical protein
MKAEKDKVPVIRNINDKKIQRRVLKKDGKDSVIMTTDLRKNAKIKKGELNQYHVQIHIKGKKIDETVHANGMSFRGKAYYKSETEEQTMDKALMRLAEVMGGEYDRDVGLKIIQSGKYKVTIKTGIISYKDA